MLLDWLAEFIRVGPLAIPCSNGQVAGDPGVRRRRLRPGVRLVRDHPRSRAEARNESPVLINLVLF